jgi:eukaryotic-like serine/threonine-protein kinase
MPNTNDLTPARWQQLAAIFDAVVRESDATRREAMMVDACGTDTALLQTLRAMIQVDGNDAASHGPASIRTLLAALTPEVDRTGSVEGGYLLTREIGHGAMGAVYAAERSDGHFHKLVAIKMLRFRARDDRSIERFQTERQLLAELDHPNIARFLDGGAASDRQPYLVMEFVDGIPIDRYCRDKDLGLAGRVELAMELCAALAYCHRKLVIHGDLKPGNILVTADGRVKLLDFGIAVLRTMEPNGEVPRIMSWMTPQYASPEQIRGAQLDTRSDVYSLGVVLYELVVGKRPYQEHEASTSALDVARLRGPEPPRSVPGSYSRAADFDAILLRCLAADPEARYQAVSDVGDDLGRFRSGFPVQAYRARWGYGGRKWITRHRLSSLIAFVAVACAALWGGALYEAQQAERRANEGVHAALDSLAVLLRLQDSLDVSPPLEIKQKVTEEGIRIMRDLASRSPKDPTLQAGMAEAYERLGDLLGRKSYANLGRLADALTAYEKCSNLLNLAGPAAPRPRLASCLMKQADIVEELRGPTAAASIYERALTIDRENLRRAPGDMRMIENVAISEQRLGNTYLDAGEIDSARRSYSASYEKFKRLAEAADVSDVTRVNYVTAIAKMAEVERKSGNHARSLSWTRQALVVDEARYRSNPANLEAQRDYSQSLYSASVAYQNLGQLDEAERLMKQCLQLDRDTLARSGADAQAKRDMLLTLIQMGALHRLSGDLVAARQYLIEAAQLSKAASPPSREATLDHAQVNINLARTDLDQQRLQAALDLMSEAEPSLHRLVDGDPSDEEARSNLAMTLWVKARIEESTGHFREADNTCQLAIASLEPLGPNLASETQALLTVVRILQARQRMRFSADKASANLRSILGDPRTNFARTLADADIFATLALAEIDLAIETTRVDQEWASAAKRDVQSALSLAPASVDVRAAAGRLREMEKLLRSQ